MLITLIAVMAAVLAGLIFVQTSMIKSASDIREEQFNRSVKTALLLVAAQLNQLEELEARRNAQQQKSLVNPVVPEGFSIFPRGSEKSSYLSFGLRITEQTSNHFIQEDFSINFLDTTRLSSDSIAFDQLFLLQQKRRREIWLRNDSWKTYKIFLEDRSIEERIDSTVLDQILKSVIAETGINTEFKYAIKNANLG
ncbi:MAG: hypothetical protein KAI79_16660, partial [Bacteroidales bacterium]|nr:hypothetical protein [Bacteroidales bacterium]